MRKHQLDGHARLWVQVHVDTMQYTSTRLVPGHFRKVCLSLKQIDSVQLQQEYKIRYMLINICSEIYQLA